MERRNGMNRILNKIRLAVNGCFRPAINRRNRNKLKNDTITVLSSNCTGCLILHDLGLRYNSPFVDIFIVADDYIRLLQNFDAYMAKELQFTDTEDCPYPVAKLGDILLHCVHYKDEQEVLEKWNRRKQRMNMSNCVVIFTDRDGCTQSHLEAFDALPYAHKVVFTKTPHEDIRSSFHISGFEDKEAVGNLHRYKGWRGIKHYDAFDYVSWFNGELQL